MRKAVYFNKTLLCRFLTIILVSCLFWGCPAEDGHIVENYGTTRSFPYFVSNDVYTSCINLFNHGQSEMDATISWYDPSGNLAFQETRIVQPHGIIQLTRSNFTGHVVIQGVGSWRAAEAQLEIVRNDHQGMALAEPCTGPGPMSNNNWYYLQGVTDMGSGQERTTIITKNSNSNQSIFIEYIPLVPFYCGLEREVEIPAKGMHIFKPLDIWGEKFPYGMEDIAIYVAGHTGPDRTGNPVACFSGTLFFEIPGEGFAVVNHKYENAVSGYHNQEIGSACLVDVRDNGTTRSDRIFIKDNGSAAGSTETFLVHFYDWLGNECPGSPKSLDLVEDFGHVGSYAILNPMDLLGRSFSGSIWITPTDGSAKVQAQVLRRWPGKWIDWASDAPGLGSDTDFTGVISYVKSPADPWKYFLAFFYSECIYRVDEDPEITVDTYGEPGTPIPEAENGVVVLTFRDETGMDRGWYAFLMQPNETRVFSFDQMVSAYLGTFTGSICFQPMISVQVEKWHAQNKGHATVNYLLPAL